MSMLPDPKIMHYAQLKVSYAASCDCLAESLPVGSDVCDFGRMVQHTLVVL